MSPFESASSEEFLCEQGLQVVTRLVALLRTGRSYSIGNQVFTGQIDQLLEVLRPTLMADGRAQLAQIDGDLYWNGVRIPLRASSIRSQEQLVSELSLRGIAGIEFKASLKRAELEEFMRFFLPSELYKGTELLTACQSAGLESALPILSAVASTNPDSDRFGSDAAPPAFASALQAYDDALVAVAALLSPAAMQRGIELRHLKRAVQPLVAAAGTTEPATVGLAWASEQDSACAHAVHVCLVAIGMGHHLGFDRRTLADLGVAALLHDLGASDCRADSPASPQAEYNLRHTVEGVRSIARSTTLNRSSLLAMRVAFEHHRAISPGNHSNVSAASALVATADAFVSLLGRRTSTGTQISPHEALGLVLGPVGEGLDEALKLALVHAVGLYPPGQVVVLDDRSLARSLAPTSEDPERPVIERLSDADGTLLPAHERVVQPLAPERHVQRAVPVEEWPDFSADDLAA